jgi:hypothetical protein
MNPYQEHIEFLFSRILELRHICSHLSSVLNDSIRKIETNANIKFISGSSLIISDWTEPQDSKWEINYHTGVSKITFKENYKEEVKKIISIECCYAFAQTFEALEEYLKDCVFLRMKQNQKFQETVQNKHPKNNSRENLPGGDNLFKLIKKAFGNNFVEITRQDEQKIRFTEFWCILSEIRHCIVHSKSVIKLSKINKSDYHHVIFNSFFDFAKYENDLIQIELDYEKLDNLLKNISEFAFQIFKLLSIQENFDWQILKK